MFIIPPPALPHFQAEKQQQASDALPGLPAKSARQKNHLTLPGEIMSHVARPAIRPQLRPIAAALRGTAGGRPLLPIGVAITGMALMQYASAQSLPDPATRQPDAKVAA